MDEIASAFPAEGSSSARRRSTRTKSFISQDSAQTAPQIGRTSRLHSPVLRHRVSSASFIANATNPSGTHRSEIIAPVPRKHHHFHVHESRHWLDTTPPLTPTSSRPVSPYSKKAGTFPRTHRMNNHHHHLSSFGSVLLQGIPSLTRARLPAEHEDSLARRSVRWMHKHGMKHWTTLCAVLVAVWVRWTVGLGSYSGQGTPPMYGDYEAQRHWMELTIHLPTRQWYTYDLEYWGLDYPPLTAYVSWLCGVVGAWLNPSWFALFGSRGIETTGSKVYMRSTVLALDLLVYIPSLILFTHVWQANRSTKTQHVALLTLLLQPALLIIDSGHFQYNSVMLGFTILAINCFATGRDLLGAVFFVLSLGFKQMALYYAPAVGSYLIAKCLYLGPTEGRRLFVQLALVTSISFVILFLPFLPPFAPLSTILHPVTRIFPFARGLFEDKVANFWCATNVVFKWKLWFPRGALVKLSTLLTAAGFLPNVIGLIYSGYKAGLTRKETPANDEGVKNDRERERDTVASNPLVPLLPYALLASSMSFFLFSFQVHEKTILVPLLPITLMMSSSAIESSTFELGALVNNVAMFSMWPLLKRDGLGLQYVALILLWNRLIGHNPLRAWPTTLLQFITLAVYSACILLHILEGLISPPARLPDIFPVLNVLVSTPVFVLTWLWSIKRGIEVGWAMGGLVFPSQPTTTTQTQSTASASVQSTPIMPRNLPFTREFSIEREVEKEQEKISMSMSMSPRAPRESISNAEMTMTTKVPPIKQLKLKNSRSFGSMKGEKRVLRASSLGPSTVVPGTSRTHIS